MAVATDSRYTHTLSASATDYAITSETSGGNTSHNEIERDLSGISLIGAHRSWMTSSSTVTTPEGVTTSGQSSSEDVGYHFIRALENGDVESESEWQQLAYVHSSYYDEHENGVSIEGWDGTYDYGTDWAGDDPDGLINPQVVLGGPAEHPGWWNGERAW